jgi:hypothetical protein
MNFLWIDLETTGASVFNDAVLEIYAEFGPLDDPNKSAAKFHALVIPEYVNLDDLKNDLKPSDRDSRAIVARHFRLKLVF